MSPVSDTATIVPKPCAHHPRVQWWSFSSETRTQMHRLPDTRGCLHGAPHLPLPPLLRYKPYWAHLMYKVSVPREDAPVHTAQPRGPWPHLGNNSRLCFSSRTFFFSVLCTEVSPKWLFFKVPVVNLE